MSHYYRIESTDELGTKRIALVPVATAILVQDGEKVHVIAGELHLTIRGEDKISLAGAPVIYGLSGREGFNLGGDPCGSSVTNIKTVAELFL